MKPRKLELTWIKQSNRWRKRRFIDGVRKDFFFDKGTSRDDMVSYESSLKQWRKIEARLDLEDEERKFKREHLRLRDELAKAESDELKKNLATQIKELDDGYSIKQANNRFELRRQLNQAASEEDWRVVHRCSQKLAKGKDRVLTFNDLIDLYLTWQQERYEHGLAVPNAPQRERISGNRLIAYTNQCKHLRAAWGDQTIPESPYALGHMISEFRRDLQKQIANGTLKPSTFNDRIKTVRNFMGWANRTYCPELEHYYIKELPNDISGLCCKYRIESTAKALDLKTIHRLWEAACPTLRAHIALGLNCGFYAVDIGALKKSDIKDGYIDSKRQKTGVPMRYKLWPITQELLRQTTNGTDDLVFAAKDGGPVYRIAKTKNGNHSRKSTIDILLMVCCKKHKIKGVTFSMFRDTSSTHIEAIDRNLTDLFDAHADNRMAKYYVDASRLDQKQVYRKLDDATDKLNEIYGLAQLNQRLQTKALTEAA